MKYLDYATDVINKVLLVLGGFAVLALMLLATGNVMLRIFHIPFRGTYEIVSFLGAIVISFALGYTLKRKDHIVVDIVSDKFPEGLKKVIDIIAYICIAVFFAIVAWQMYVWGMKLWDENEVSETLKIIYYPFVFACALGFAAISLSAFVDLLKKIIGRGE
jgi:TRAP-type C4-dicarboxylate transport system permease small subunit